MNSTRTDPITEDNDNASSSVLSLLSSSSSSCSSSFLSIYQNSVLHEDHCDDSESLTDNINDDDVEESGDVEMEEEQEKKEKDFDDEQSRDDEEEGSYQEKDHDDLSSDDDDDSSCSHVPSPIIIKKMTSQDESHPQQHKNHHDDNDDDHDSTSSIVSDHKDICDQQTNHRSIITQQDLNNLYSILYWEFHPNVQPSSNQESLFQWVTCALSKYNTGISIEMIKSIVLRMLIDHKFCNDNDDAIKIVDQLGKCLEDDSVDPIDDYDDVDVDRDISNNNLSSSIPIKKRKVSSSWPFMPSESSVSSTISSLSASSSSSSSSLKKRQKVLDQRCDNHCFHRNGEKKSSLKALFSRQLHNLNDMIRKSYNTGCISGKAERYHYNYSDGKENKNLPHQNNHGVSFKTRKA